MRYAMSRTIVVNRHLSAFDSFEGHFPTSLDLRISDLFGRLIDRDPSETQPLPAIAEHLRIISFLSNLDVLRVPTVVMPTVFTSTAVLPPFPTAQIRLHNRDSLEDD